MSNNNEIKIGGVTFSKSNVKSAEVIVKDGKKINSVFLQDGTHIEFPTQSEKNNSKITTGYPRGFAVSQSQGFNPRSGKVEPHLTLENTVDKSSGKTTWFERISGAKITGTENADEYTLLGCNNTTVDVSQDDGQFDYVQANQSAQGDTVWSNDNNTFKLGDSDQLTTVRDFYNSLWPSCKDYKGEGTYNSGTDKK